MKARSAEADDEAAQQQQRERQRAHLRGPAAGRLRPQVDGERAEGCAFFLKKGGVVAGPRKRGCVLGTCADGHDERRCDENRPPS